MKQAMGEGQIFNAHTFATQQKTVGNGVWTEQEAELLQIKNNYLGGVDVSIDGEAFYLKSGEREGDGRAWQQRTGVNETYKGLTLWNAGKGGQDGLFEDAEGQVYHKIVGYDYGKGTSKRMRGHAILGEKTPVANMAKLPRQASYDGYFVLKSDPTVLNGGLTIKADFNKGTVNGSVAEVIITHPRALAPIASGSGMTFSGNITGATYTATSSSGVPALEGATVKGAFFGAGAQETAGTITNQVPGTNPVEGFFSAADPSAK